MPTRKRASTIQNRARIRVIRSDSLARDGVLKVPPFDLHHATRSPRRALERRNREFYHECITHLSVFSGYPCNCLSAVPSKAHRNPKDFLGLRQPCEIKQRTQFRRLVKQVKWFLLGGRGAIYSLSVQREPRDSRVSFKRNSCPALFHRQSLSFSHSPPMSPDGLKEIIDVGNDL